MATVSSTAMTLASMDSRLRSVEAQSRTFRAPVLVADPDDFGNGLIWARDDQDKVYIQVGASAIEILTSLSASGLGGMIPDHSIVDAKLALNTLTASSIADGAIGTGELATAAVDGTKWNATVTATSHLDLTADTTGAVPLVVRATPTHTVDVVNVFDHTPALALTVSKDGRTRLGPVSASNGLVTIHNSQIATDTSLVVRQGSGQTGKPVEVINSSSTVVASVDWAGKVTSASEVSAVTLTASTTSTLAAAGATTLSVSSTAGVSGTLSANGGLLVTGDFGHTVKRGYPLTRAMPAGLNDVVSLGVLTLAGDSGHVRIVAASDTGTASVTKTYEVPIIYDGTASAWQTLLPVVSTGAQSSNDWALEISISTTTATLRARRVAGAVNYNLSVYVEVVAAAAGYTWAPSTSVLTAQAAPGASYAASVLQVSPWAITDHTITGAKLAYDTVTGGAGIGVGNLAAGTIYGYNIHDSAVTYAKLSLPAIAAADGYLDPTGVHADSLAVGVLTSGTLNADEIFLGSSGNIYLGPTTHAGIGGSRVELNSAGLYGYSGSTALFTLLGSGTDAGKVTLKTATSGSRTELDPTGLRFFAADGITKTLDLKTSDGSAVFGGALQAATGTFAGDVVGGSFAVPSTVAASRVVIDDTADLGIQVWWGGVQTVDIPLDGSPTFTGITVNGTSNLAGLLNVSGASGVIGLPDSIAASRVTVDATNGIQLYQASTRKVNIPLSGQVEIVDLKLSGTGGTLVGDIASSGTITGGTLRTTATGSRVEMTTGGLSFYATDGTTKNVELKTSDGSAVFAGNIASTATISGGSVVGAMLSSGAAGQARVVIQPSSTGNLVANPSFEAALTGWTLNADKYDATHVTDIAQTRDTGQHSTGVASLKLVSTNIVNATPYSDSYSACTVAVTPNTSYLVTVMVRCSVRTNGALGNRCLAVSGNHSAGTGFVSTTLTAITTDWTEWVQHQLYWTADASDTVLTIRLYGVKGTIYYDDVWVGAPGHFYGGMALHSALEYVPAETAEVAGGLYGGDWSQGGAGALDVTAMVLRSPGFAAHTGADFSQLLLQSSSRDLSSASYAKLDAVNIDIGQGYVGTLTLESSDISLLSSSGVALEGGTGGVHADRWAVGSGGIGGTNRTTRYRSTGFVHASSGSWLAIDFNADDGTVADDGIIYNNPYFTAQAVGVHVFTASFTGAATAGTYGIRWITNGGKVLGQQNGTANQVLALSGQRYFAVGEGVKLEVYQNAGASITIPQDSSSVFRVSFARVSG